MRIPFALLILLFLPVVLKAQQPVRRLPGIINHPSLNLFAPYMSADGNAIVFTSDAGQDGQYVVSYVSRELDWTAPVELPKHLSSRLNFTRGYALSADGKRLYVTSAKSPVIGGYDIFVSELRNGVWSSPENLMLPLNSKTNDGCPSVTPDGNTIYFMRCDRMNTEKAEGCKLFRASKKPNGQWEEPQELPDFINTGNSQTPRILADKETLIFSSDKMPGNKGGMDLYLARWVDGRWTQPEPLTFANTERDDQYVSVNALGRYLIKEAKGQRNNWELTEFLIPNELKPKSLTKVEGSVKGKDGSPVSAYIAVTDIFSGKRIHSIRPAADGSYFFYLTEGSTYEIAFDPEKSENSYQIKLLDLTGDKIQQKEKINVTMGQPEPGDEFDLSALVFKPYSSEIDPGSTPELKRLSRMIRANPAMGFEIQVFLQGYMESPDQADPELTETIESADSIQTTDTTGMLVDSVHYRQLYHNDRTPRQAKAIVDFLISDGVDPGQLTTLVNAIENSEGTRPSTTIRTRVYNRR